MRRLRILSAHRTVLSTSVAKQKTTSMQTLFLSWPQDPPKRTLSKRLSTAQFMNSSETCFLKSKRTRSRSGCATTRISFRHMTNQRLFGICLAVFWMVTAAFQNCVFESIARRGCIPFKRQSRWVSSGIVVYGKCSKQILILSAFRIQRQVCCRFSLLPPSSIRPQTNISRSLPSNADE